MKNPRDRVWLQRATRRYGRILDAALRDPSGARRDALVNVTAWLMKWDRRALLWLGR